MRKLLLIGVALLYCASALPLASVDQTASSAKLTASTMAGLMGEGCSQSAGIMVSAAFVSGLAWAPVPLFGQVALLGAIAFGVAVVLTC